jgi:cell division protein FtsL
VCIYFLYAWKTAKLFVAGTLNELESTLQEKERKITRLSEAVAENTRTVRDKDNKIHHLQTENGNDFIKVKCQPAMCNHLCVCVCVCVCFVVEKIATILF